MQNNPLYIQTFQSQNKISGMQEDPIKFHYVLHCSLDAFEERGKAHVRKAEATFDGVF